MPRLIIIASTPRDQFDQAFDSARLLFQAAQTANITTQIVTHQSVHPEVRQVLEAIPHFPGELNDDLVSPLVARCLTPHLRTRLNARLHFQRDLKSLQALRKKIAWNADTVLFFTAIRERQIPPLVRFVEGLSVHERSRLVLLLGNTSYPVYEQPSPAADDFRRAFRALKQSRALPHFRLVTHSELLRDEFAEYTALQVDLVGIPCESGAPVPGHSAGGTLALGYVGPAATNHGIHFLPALFRALLPELRSERIRGTIHLTGTEPGDRESRLAIQRLRQLPVQFAPQPLRPFLPPEWLQAVDLLILPCRLEHHHSEVSPPFCQAVAAGTPVLVPRGTWMSHTLSTCGAGLTFLPDDPCSLEAAVRSAIADYPRLKLAAAKQREAWIARNRAHVVLEQLLGGRD